MITRNYTGCDSTIQPTITTTHLHILEYKLIKSPWRKCWQTNRG